MSSADASKEEEEKAKGLCQTKLKSAVGY